MKNKGLKSGTTTIGIICKNGVVLAAEKKATMGYLVASKEVIKIEKITPYIAVTQSGMVGDLQALIRQMRAESTLFELQNRRKIPVKSAATLLANILYSKRSSFFPYYVELILGGFDDNGPQLFIISSDGSCLKEKKFFSTGSGSPIAFGVLETLFKEGVSMDECKKIAVKAVKAAIERDIASGGKGIDVAVIDKSGFKMLKEKEVEEIKKQFH